MPGKSGSGGSGGGGGKSGGSSKGSGGNRGGGSKGSGPGPRYRDSRTGEYVSENYAKRHPDTTQRDDN